MQGPGLGAESGLGQEPTPHPRARGQSPRGWEQRTIPPAQPRPGIQLCPRAPHSPSSPSQQPGGLGPPAGLGEGPAKGRHPWGGAAGLTRQAGFVSEKDKRSHLRAQNHMWKVTEAGSLDVLMAGPGPRPPPGAPHGHGAGASTGEGSRGLHPTGALLETPGAVRQGAGEPQYQRKRPTSPPGPGTIQRAACEAPEWPPSGQGTAHPSGMQSLGARPADQIRISRGGALGMEGADLAGA